MAVAMAKRVEGGEDRMTDELKELRELAKKVGINDYMMAARDGRPVTGAAAEYNTHVFGHNAAGDMPVEILGEREQILKFEARDWQDIKETEHRAAITGTNVNPGVSVNYISQLFATSEAAFCGASFPAVGVGDHSYPIFSKSTTAGDFGRDASEPESAGSVTINTATNRRLQSSMVLTSEDENRIPNIAGGLTSHLRAGLQETLDKYVIDQLRAGIPDVAATGTTETLSAFAARVGALVDGKGARNVGEVRGLLNTVRHNATTPSLFSLLSGLSLASGGSHFWELPRLSDPELLQGLGASSHRDGCGCEGNLYPSRRGGEPRAAPGSHLAARSDAPRHRRRPAARAHPVHRSDVRSGRSDGHRPALKSRSST